MGDKGAGRGSSGTSSMAGVEVVCSSSTPARRANRSTGRRACACRGAGWTVRCTTWPRCRSRGRGRRRGECCTGRPPARARRGGHTACPSTWRQGPIHSFPSSPVPVQPVHKGPCMCCLGLRGARAGAAGLSSRSLFSCKAFKMRLLCFQALFPSLHALLCRCQCCQPFLPFLRHPLRLL